MKNSTHSFSCLNGLVHFFSCYTTMVQLSKLVYLTTDPSYTINSIEVVYIHMHTNICIYKGVVYYKYTTAGMLHLNNIYKKIMFRL